MARFDCSGAEVGSVIELDSTTTTLSVGAFSSSTDQARSGSRSWKAQITGSTLGTDQASGRMTVAGAPLSFSLRMSIFIPSGATTPTPSTYGAFRVNFGAAESLVWSVQVEPTGFFLYDNDDSIKTLGAASLYAYDTWHNFRLQVFVRTGAGALEDVIARCGSDSVSYSRSFATAGVSSVDFGCVGVSTGPANLTIYVDDIVFDNSNTDIGSEFNLAFFAPSATDTPQLTLTGAATHHAAVTDESDTSTVGYTASTANIVDIFSATDPRPSIPATAAVAVACVYGSCRNGGAVDTLAGVSRVFLWILSGVNSAFARPAPALVPTTRRSVLVSTTRPGGGAWQSADMAILKPTVGKETSTLAESFTFQEVWLYAELIVNVTPTDTPAISEGAAPVVYTEGLGGGGAIIIINE